MKITVATENDLRDILQFLAEANSSAERFEYIDSVGVIEKGRIRARVFRGAIFDATMRVLLFKDEDNVLMGLTMTNFAELSNLALEGLLFAIKRKGTENQAPMELREGSKAIRVLATVTSPSNVLQNLGFEQSECVGLGNKNIFYYTANYEI